MASLFSRHIDGLANLRNGGRRKPAYVLRAALYLAPIALAVLSAWKDWDLRRVSDALVAGCALTAGVLVGVFAQVAAWRIRLDDRASFRPASEAEARRSVDAAAAHALVGVVASVIAVAVAVLVSGSAPTPRLWSAALAGIGLYVLLIFLVIVQSVFVGYERNVDSAVREADQELAFPTQTPGSVAQSRRETDPAHQP